VKITRFTLHLQFFLSTEKKTKNEHTPAFLPQHDSNQNCSIIKWISQLFNTLTVLVGWQK